MSRYFIICNFCKCKNIEDELHFFIHCAKNCNVMKIFVLSGWTLKKEVTQLSENENKNKLIAILTDFRKVQSLVWFWKIAVELRTGDSQTSKPAPLICWISLYIYCMICHKLSYLLTYHEGSHTWGALLKDFQIYMYIFKWYNILV